LRKVMDENNNLRDELEKAGEMKNQITMIKGRFKDFENAN